MSIRSNLLLLLHITTEAAEPWGFLYSVSRLMAILLSAVFWRGERRVK